MFPIGCDCSSASNGSTAETDLEKAEMFNNFFSSQTLLENGFSPPDKSSFTKTPVFDSMKTTSKEVFDILCQGKAAGIDEITPDLLRSLVYERDS